jgi:hypothetical protein
LLPLPTYKCQTEKNISLNKKKKEFRKNENKKWHKTEKRG